ncbi:hypothetical protein TRFO_08500 [Tritrichomonas foetus]|uniref:Uncharacterized protein n=1 Tax=Tritrichomonas foetus TaxID=1144522 RepID=A0A1J4JPR0_9EUKA|nr:hypothetical protein TRFO_08500 [Tritrichomonas foetus]|eukprot:OHS99252.1 hypothetical protein TRFO_08500 [Tritrichomonas foetus]
MSDSLEDDLPIDISSISKPPPNDTRNRKRRKKSKRPKFQKPIKINFEKFLDSDPENDNQMNSETEKSFYGYNQKKNYEYENLYENQQNMYLDESEDYHQPLPKDYNTYNDYEFTVEELFEEMVIKVDDYFQNSIDDMIDSFCYDLLILLDESTYIEDTVNQFVVELSESIQKSMKFELKSFDFNEEDADYIFEPYSDPFFESFLNASDFYHEPTKISANKIRFLRTKIANSGRDFTNKFEDSFQTLLLNLNELEIARNQENQIKINKELNLKHLKELQKTFFQNEFKLNLLRLKSEAISKKSRELNTKLYKVKEIPEYFSQDDVNFNINVFSKIVQNFLDKQNLLKTKIIHKQDEMITYQNNLQDSRQDSIFLLEMLNKNIDNLLSHSKIESTINSMNLSPRATQLTSFEDDTSILSFKLKSHKNFVNKVIELEQSQMFMEEVKADNEFYNSIL